MGPGPLAFARVNGGRHRSRADGQLARELDVDHDELGRLDRSDADPSDESPVTQIDLSHRVVRGPHTVRLGDSPVDHTIEPRVDEDGVASHVHELPLLTDAGLDELDSDRTR